VEERRHCSHRAFAIAGQHGVRLTELRHHVPMRQHHSLGKAAGAARVGQHQQILGWIDGNLGKRTVLAQLGERRRPGCVFQAEDLAHRGALRCLART
jgi:hypothetical protein